MPLPKGTRYGVVTRGKSKVRLAFEKGTNKVIEAKNLKTGATHTRQEFKQDELRAKKNRLRRALTRS